MAYLSRGALLIMPTYSYYCESCANRFELFASIRDYKDTVKCDKCNQKATRDYQPDILSQSASVKKSDSELKTLGDLANRNRDRMSSDQIDSLNKKHNAYRETPADKPLPKGMSRMKKPNKIKWRTK